jgi:hypothetical protein
MKWFAYTIVILLVGIAIGGWSPRIRLRQLEDSLDALRREAKQHSSGRESVGTAFGDLLRIPDEVTDRSGKTANPTNATESAENATPVETPGEETLADDVGQTLIETNTVQKSGDLDERIEQAVEAWRLRSEVARDQYLERIQADDQESINFQVLMAHMNIRIGDSIDVWAAAIRKDEIVGEEAMIRMTSEITVAMALTYDQLDAKMPEGWRESDGGSFTLTDFLDPDVASPLIGLEDEIDL